MSTAARWKVPASTALVVLLAIVAYAPILHNGFIMYDDVVYVTSNDTVRRGLTAEGVAWAFTTALSGNWHPVAWLSHMLDVELFGLNAAGHHATSLLLHSANSLLLLFLLFRLTGYWGRSLAVALLFALHPLHVESVAWVAERKDLLSTFFGFLTIWAYLAFVQKPRPAQYLAVVCFFVLGLMSKSMLVTLPMVLLFMDYWPLGRIRTGEGGAAAARKLVTEKLPLIALSIAASIGALYTQSAAGTVDDAGYRTLAVNAGNALISYVKYIWMMFWPAKLAVFYPFDIQAVSPFKVAGAVCILTVLTALAVRDRGRRPYLLFGWLWYLVTLLPVIGFVRIGSQALADRYTYLPLIGLFLIVVWGGAELFEKLRLNAQATVAAAGIVTAILLVMTRVQSGYWRDNAELFRHALAVTENNWVAHNNYGVDLMVLHRFDEGIMHFQAAVSINPRYLEAYRNLGDAYMTVGNTLQGIATLRKAVEIDPTYAKGRLSLGYAYLNSGRPNLAREEYLQLQRINERDAQALGDAIGMKTTPPAR